MLNLRQIHDKWRTAGHRRCVLATRRALGCLNEAERQSRPSK